MRLSELAGIVNGQIPGGADPEITNVAPIETAKTGDLIFVLAEKALDSALRSKASALVASPNQKIIAKPAILVKNPRQAMVKLLPLFALKTKKWTGIHKTALVPKSCSLGRNVSLGPYVVLGDNVVIGNNTVIYPNVTVYDNTIIGSNVILHAGCCIGMDGYGFVQEGKKHVKIPQIGNVVIEDNVELFANVCVSRATLGSTVIGAGTKIDNLTHVAHNCKIGKNCAIVSLVGFGGSVTLKDNVYVAGQAGFTGHLTVGENTVVMAKSGVTKDIAPNSLVSGFPAQDHHKEMAIQAVIRRLAKKPR